MGDLNHCATYPTSGTLFITCVKKKEKCTKTLHQNFRKVTGYKKRGLVPSNVVSLTLLLVRQHYWYVFVFMLYIELFNFTPPPFFFLLNTGRVWSSPGYLRLWGKYVRELILTPYHDYKHNVFSIYSSLYNSWGADSENLFNNQELLSLVIISFILVTFRFDSGLIL